MLFSHCSVIYIASIEVSTWSGCGRKTTGMLNDSARFLALVSHVKQFKAHRNKFFADIYQFVVVIARTDTYNSRSGGFRTPTTMDRQTKLIALPLAHARGELSPNHCVSWHICLPIKKSTLPYLHNFYYQPVGSSHCCIHTCRNLQSWCTCAGSHHFHRHTHSRLIIKVTAKNA